MEARIKDKIKEIEEFLFELNEIAPNEFKSYLEDNKIREIF